MRLFYKTLGIVLILAGLPLFWTPVPVGAVLILAGLALLAANSETAQTWLRRQRSKHPKLNRWMNNSEKYLPGRVRRSIDKTHPDQS